MIVRASVASLSVTLALAVGPAGAGERRPVAEPARSCPQHGPGFVEIPGTSTCIRIGGRARSEYGASTRRVRRDDIGGFRSGAQVSADVRTETDYGPARAFVRMRASTGALPYGR